MGDGYGGGEKGSEFGIAEYFGRVLPRVDGEVDLSKVLNAGRGQNGTSQIFGKFPTLFGREEFDPGEGGPNGVIHGLGGVDCDLAEKAGQTLDGLGPADVACGEAEVEVGGIAAAQHYVVLGEVGNYLFGLSEEFGEGALDDLHRIRISELIQISSNYRPASP